MAGIYIHIPFCKQACNYCNFHFSTSLKLKEDLISALIQEIILAPRTSLISTTAPFIANIKQEKEEIDTIYFGGGTPSILEIDDLHKIFEALHIKFSFNNDIEITLEANPDDITPEKLALWKLAGINR